MVAAIVCLLAGSVGGLLPARADGGVAAEEMRATYWADPATGFAIGGYDPVAYFVDGEARQGRVGYEYRWRGVVWRFVNSGNCAAFIANPEVYAPRFGGFDTVTVSRGLVAEANPTIWAIHKNRLYFFSSPTHRIIFTENPDDNARRAAQAWREMPRSQFN